jgi:hypothetical protein
MWKDIEGYEGLYQVSDQGQVQRILADGTAKPVKPRDGVYLTVSLSKNSKATTFNIHRLVAEAFLPRQQHQDEVNHKDGNKHNNRLENLEWVTKKENLVHAIQKLGKFPYGKPARKVKCIDIESGQVVAEYYSLAESARAIGKASARASITLCCQGLQNSAYGYKWEYVE